MLAELLSFMTSFATNLGTAQLSIILVILVAFIVFLVLMKKILKTIINAVWIGLVSAIFPVVMNLVFGFAIPLKIDTILFFVIFGLGLYFIYIIGKLIYFGLGLAEKSAKTVAYPITSRSKGKRDERDKKLDGMIKKEEETQKAKEKAEKERKKAEKQSKR